MLDHRLTVLRTLAACGTVTAAAEALGYSPSAVSSQLREYQRGLGVPLVERDGRGLALTAAGKRLVERSDELLALWEGVEGDVRAAAGDAAPAELRMGGFSTATASLISPVAARLREEEPGLIVHIVEADPRRCLELLSARRLDLAIIVAMHAPGGAEPRPTEEIPLLDDPLDVLLPEDHPLAGRAALSLEELGEEDWITDRVGTPYRALFATAFTAAGATPRVVHEVSDWGSQEALVSDGLGVAFVPRLVRSSADARAVRVPLSGPSAPSRRVLAVVRKGSLARPVLARAVEALREAAAQHAALPAAGDD